MRTVITIIKDESGIPLKQEEEQYEDNSFAASVYELLSLTNKKEKENEKFFKQLKKHRRQFDDK